MLTVRVYVQSCIGKEKNKNKTKKEITWPMRAIFYSCFGAAQVVQQLEQQH